MTSFSLVLLHSNWDNFLSSWLTEFLLKQLRENLSLWNCITLVSYMIDFLKEIAERENATLTIKDKVIKVGMGVRSPNILYTFKTRHEEIEITISNDLGTIAIGKAYCRFPENMEPLDFKIETRSNFIIFFFGNRKRFKISSSDERFIVFLRSTMHQKDILALIKSTQFEPYIFSIQNLNCTEIIAEYNLMFANWTDSIGHIFNIYKQIID